MRELQQYSPSAAFDIVNVGHIYWRNIRRRPAVIDCCSALSDDCFSLLFTLSLLLALI